MRCPLHWPRVPQSQFCFLPQVVTLLWNGSFRFWSYCCLLGLAKPDRWIALEVWSSIKNSVRYWEGLSKSKRTKSSSYKCWSQITQMHLYPASFIFFLTLPPYLRTFWLFSKVMLLWSISLWCLRKDFSQNAGSNLQKGFNGCLWRYM